MTRKLKFWDATKNLLQDSLKAGINYLVFKLLLEYMLGITGISIILVVVLLLLRFISWLKIPIVMPAYAVAVAIVLVIGGVLIFQGVQRKLRSRRLRSVVLDGLLFEVLKDGTVLGPSCAKCKAKPVVVCDPEENITRVIFGKGAIYNYLCTCGYQVVSSKPSDELLKEAQEHFYREKSAA